MRNLFLLLHPNAVFDIMKLRRTSEEQKWRLRSHPVT